MRGADLGVEVVQRVRRHPEWAYLRCAEWPRGFVSSRFGSYQRVWSEPRVDYERRPAWRVRIHARCLAGFEGRPGQWDALSLDMANGALASVIRDPEDATRLQLASTLHVHGGNAGWAADLVAFVAGWQACQARRLGRTSALLGLGARPDLAEGAEPGSWTDAEGDLMSRLTAAPAGAAGVWPAAEVQASVELLRRQRGVQAAVTPRGLTASFASARRSTVRWRVLLEVDTAAQRPGGGRGLSVLLVPPPREGGAEMALSLNERELLPDCRTDLLGGWSVREGVLRHSAFLPDAVYRPGLLLRVVLAAVRRVEWIL